MLQHWYLILTKNHSTGNAMLEDALS